MRPFARQPVPERHEFRRGERDGDATAEGAQTGRHELERALLAADLVEQPGHLIPLLPRKRMEQREVGRDEVALRREVPAPQVVEIRKGAPVERERQDERGGGRLTQNRSVAFASSSCAMRAFAASRAR